MATTIRNAGTPDHLDDFTFRSKLNRKTYFLCKFVGGCFFVFGRGRFNQGQLDVCVSRNVFRRMRNPGVDSLITVNLLHLIKSCWGNPKIRGDPADTPTFTRSH